MKSSPHFRDRQPDRRRESNRRRRTGRKKLFAKPDSVRERTGVNSRLSEAALREMRLELPEGPVLQAYSSLKRHDITTFLMNSSRVHTVFRSLLEGSGGGFEGPLNGLVLAYQDGINITGALAILPDRTWYIHALNIEALVEVIESVPEDLSPRKIEGESGMVEKAVKSLGMRGLTAEELVKCIHLEAPSRLSVHSTEGKHRLAKPTDITRLEEYASEFGLEVGESPNRDWRNLIAEKAIMLGIVEGTIASVAIRSASTIDRVLIEGVYTFKPFRHRGLARSLIATVAMQAVGRSQVTVSVVPISNEIMMGLLTDLGFHKSADYLVAKYKIP